MVPVEFLSEHLIRLKIPLPFALRYVNCYLIRGSRGYTVIDPGLRTKEAEVLWLAVLSELRAMSQHVEQIVLTHHHPDHYGMAGWLQERTNAPVLLSETGIRQAALLWRDEQPLSARLLELFARHGLARDQQTEMTKHMQSFVEMVSPHPEVTVLAEGAVRFGDGLYEAIQTPGHAAGHMCFYNAEEKHILCGDHVLPHISPNVSFLPGVEANPLGAYLISLQSISKLMLNMAYPGHREPWPDFAERALEIIAHHQQRLLQMIHCLHHPLTAYEVCLMIFGQQLNTHQLRFALAETIAHLVYLENNHLIMSVDVEESVIRFSR